MLSREAARVDRLILASLDGGNAMDGSTDALSTLLLCALMGTLGQGVRAVLGLKSNLTGEAKPPTEQSTFSAAFLLTTLMIGAFAGILAGIGLGLKEVNADPANLKTLAGLIAAGYAGADFIENAFATLVPSAFRKPTVAGGKPDETTRQAPSAPNMTLASHLVGSDQTIISANQVIEALKSPPTTGSAGPATPDATAASAVNPIHGFDCENYPGDAAMDWLASKGSFRVSVLYLANQPGVQNRTWTDEYNALRQRGWGLLPTYAGLQIASANLSAAKGTIDGAEAATIMASTGFPLSSIVYLDLEDGTIPSGAYLEYIRAWIATVQSKQFTPALYCSHLLADWARQRAKLTDIIWSFKIPTNSFGEIYDPDKLPVGTIVPGCIATQYRQKIRLTGLTIPPVVDAEGLDLNVCAVADPSNLAVVKHALGL